MEGPFSLGAWGKMFTEGRALNSSGEAAGGVEIAESGEMQHRLMEQSS